MRAFVLTGLKQPLQAQDRPVPEPGADQVRIRIRASGVCGTDLHVWAGELPVPLPLVLGHEPVGTVDAVGPGVTSLRAGDRVGVSWFQDGSGRCTYPMQQVNEVMSRLGEGKVRYRAVLMPEASHA